MNRGLEFEGAFARALLDADADVPASLVGRRGASASRRFAVYRNNVYASLIDVLAKRFPASARLVGDEFFRAMARVYVERKPPGSPVLLYYGADFADFVSSFPPASPVPYLADVVRLEWAWHTAYHAKDAVPVSLSALAEVGESAERAKLNLHPSTRLLRSPYPIITIWQLAVREGDDAPIQLPADGEDALVVRPLAEVEVRHLPAGGGAFVEALLAGATLSEAARNSFRETPSFDLKMNLAGLISSGAIIGVEAS